MSCLLCLEENENCIEIDSDEGRDLKVANILHKHFSVCFHVCIWQSLKNLRQRTLKCMFCFQEAPTLGVVCRKCWWKVDIFHQFYLHIQALHDARDESESIFVSEIGQIVKTDVGEEDKHSVEHLNENDSLWEENSFNEEQHDSQDENSAKDAPTEAVNSLVSQPKQAVDKSMPRPRNKSNLKILSRSVAKKLRSNKNLAIKTPENNIFR